ncbi:site-2 protease family protein [Candidatus Micrarchaeota archaeon]|nr:site-2 protease family protein [Candidatus Micrarchaeota archaeon]
MILLFLIILLAIAVFYGILQTDFSGVIKFFLVVLEMVLVSQFMIRKYKLPSEMGLVLLKSERGIKLINELAQRQKTWEFLSDMGSTLSYGLLSTVLMRKNTSLPSVAAGIACMLVITLLVAPIAMEFLKAMLTGTPVLEKNQLFQIGDAQTMAIIAGAVMLFGGFFLMLLLSILLYGFHILAQAIQFILTGVNTLASTSPGGTLLLPGVNLPFFEGILALIAIMAVHEGSHAVLARIANVKIKSSGVVLFGIIPIGAFVEPDEKQLERVEAVRQTRVLVAGSTANFVSSILLFILFVALALLLKSGFVGASGDMAYQAIRFLYITVGLAFSLNFVIATVNLLPLPLFDGYRVLEINIQNKHVVNAIMFITLAAFALNFLPYFFAG